MWATTNSIAQPYFIYMSFITLGLHDLDMHELAPYENTFILDIYPPEN